MSPGAAVPSLYVTRCPYVPQDGTTDHDGDIDDYSEPESTENETAEPTMYYPQCNDDGAR